MIFLNFRVFENVWWGIVGVSPLEDFERGKIGLIVDYWPKESPFAGKASGIEFWVFDGLKWDAFYCYHFRLNLRVSRQ